MLRACELRLIDRSLQISYDSLGNKYDLPVFVINPPERHDVKQESSVNFGGRRTRLRLQYLSHLKEVEVGLDDKVSAVLRQVEKLVQAAEPFDATQFSLRLVYQGRLWKEESPVGLYVQNEALVQVFKTMKT